VPRVPPGDVAVISDAGQVGQHHRARTAVLVLPPERITMTNAGGAVSPTPYQGGVGGNDPSVNGNDAPALSLHSLALCRQSVLQNSDRVAPPVTTKGGR
jgi:hypothetical protein